MGNIKNFRILILVVLIIIVLSVVVLSSTNTDKEEGINTDIPSNNENSVSQSLVIAKVYVQPPNFDVLYEKNSKEITIIKDAEIPLIYNGTLIKLRTKDLSHIEKVLVNLRIDKIIMYHEDIEIAEKLIKSDFNVILK